MRIITAANPRYYGAIQPYIDSLNRYSQIPVTLVCVTNNILYGGTILNPAKPVRLSPADNYGAPVETECPQHGAWLQAVDGPEDEVCIFTDGDIILQRAFTDSEMDWLANWPADAVGMGYNSGPAETLAVEAGRLFPRVTLEALAAVFGDLSRPCYNIAVFIARRATFRRIYEQYKRGWLTVTDAFGHPARQQWLVVHSVHTLGLPVIVTPYSFHANGHYGIPPGCNYRDGQLYWNDELVAFRHKL